MRLHLPLSYPLTPSSIRLDLNPEIPEPLRRLMVNSYALKTGRVGRGLSLVQMMQWVDRESEKMLSKPLDAPKISFVSNSSLGVEEERPLNTFSTMFGERRREGEEISDNDDEEREEHEDQDEETPSQTISLPAPKRGGIEIRLPSPTLKGIALLSCVSLSLVVKCTRCKAMSEVKAISFSSTISCSKCPSQISIAFTPVLMHPGNHFSIGSVDVQGGVPVDILASTYYPTCESCTRENRTSSVFRHFFRGPVRVNCGISHPLLIQYRVLFCGHDFADRECQICWDGFEYDG
jgi:hypothetical protein